MSFYEIIIDVNERCLLLLLNLRCVHVEVSLVVVVSWLLLLLPPVLPDRGHWSEPRLLLLCCGGQAGAVLPARQQSAQGLGQWRQPRQRGAHPARCAALYVV